MSTIAGGREGMPAVRATVRSRRFLVLEEEAVSEVAEEEEEVVVVVMMSDWMTRGRKPPERSVAVGCRNAEGRATSTAYL